MNGGLRSLVVAAGCSANASATSSSTAIRATTIVTLGLWRAVAKSIRCAYQLEECICDVDLVTGLPADASL
ncbi:hypothetical protein BH18ACT11_BH18ACT11_24850 [soil metagenome]